MPQIPPNYQPIPGSEINPLHGARRTGPANPSEVIQIAVCLRPRPGAPPLPNHAHWLATSPKNRKFLTPQEFAARHGAAQEDIDAVLQFARAHDLAVVQTDAACSTVFLSGTVEAVSRAFAVDLSQYESPAGAYRGHEGPLHVPAALAPIVSAVFGLDNRRTGGHNSTGDPSGTTQTVPPDIAKLYNFPPVPANIANQTIGVIEFGGGWNQTDLDDTLFLFGAPSVTPNDVPITGSNNPGSKFSPHEADGEVVLDICVAAAVAPGAKINVYWGTDTFSQTDWIAVLNGIIKNPPTVLSCSWVLVSGDDQISTSQASAISAKFQSLAGLGVTVFAACGDDGARSRTFDSKAHVQYPGSDPWVTSCGGTTISTTPSYVEWVWNDFNPIETTVPQGTGGGVSVAFPGPLPPWQQVVTVPPSINDGTSVGRGVPDVAGNASLNSGYQLTVDGGAIPGPFGGTSAVAPLYAGLMAIINATLGNQVGFLNPTLYAFRDTVCRDINAKILPGSPPGNSMPAFTDPNTSQHFPAVTGYPSVAGWDACTGLGVVDGGALLGALQTVYQKDCQFIVDRTQIGKDEVSNTLSGPQPGIIANAFYVVLDGFSPTDPALNVKPSGLFPNAPSPVPVFTSSVSGLTVVATALFAEDVTLPSTPQRFTWLCEAQFDISLSAFTTVPVSVNLTATIAAIKATATIELVANADPYELDGPTWWLSQDLRVFQITTGGSLQGLPAVTLKDTGDPQKDAPTFIKAVIAGFNANTTPPPSHPFDQISTDEQVSEVTLDEFSPSTSTTRVYNFAVARVRYSAAAASQLVRVFFRIFQASTTSTAYNTQTYGSVSNSGVSTSGKIPVFGVDGAGNVVAIPCFADARVPAGIHLDQQADDTNVLLTGIPPTAGGITYTYFGCWLDINQSATKAVPLAPVAPDSVNPWATGSQSVLAAITGQHQCLVAEISYDADPAKTGDTPASSDKLAQRNLAVISSGNPGGPLSHRVPHTFDIRSTPSQLPAGASPDELMILWGALPSGSVGTIYLPSVSAAAILELAAKMYPVQLLEFVDEHTLRCRATGVTWIPIPPGSAANYAGLLTVDLPPVVRRGEAYTIVVRQITSATVARKGLDALPASVRLPPHRLVLGSFQISIPVSIEEALLEPEESLLSIMRWIKLQRPPTDRWTPVLDRYVAQIAQRVKGFGGDPRIIPPSPSGNWYQPPDGRGSLVITFVDSSGNPVSDIADVFLRHLESDDRREIRRWPTDVPLIVRDLLAADIGIYELQALPEHHELVRQFVTIREGQVTRIQLTLETH